MTIESVAPVGGEGYAALVVLSSPVLFRDIVVWSSGWPALVARRWREIKTALNVAVLPTRDFMWELIWRSDLRTLELTKRIHNQRFIVDDINPAITAGHANAVRLAHQFSAPAVDIRRQRHWALALDKFPGHVDVLEALDALEPLEEINVWLTVGPSGSGRVYSRQGVLSTGWRLNVGKVDSVVLAEWLLNKFGPARLPSSLIDAVAIRGNLALVRFLGTVASQVIKPHTFHDVYRRSQQQTNEQSTFKAVHSFYQTDRPSPLDTNERAQFTAVLDYLLQHREEPHTCELEVACLDAGDHAMLSLIQETRGLRFLQDVNIDAAASRGHLKVIQFLVVGGRATCTSSAMDRAAANGYSDVVKYLHSSSFATCTSAAMDSAARNGHLETVQFLHFNRSEGCSQRAMDLAAARGFLEVVRFLHENRREGCTTQAMDCAARIGCLRVVQFLHENRREGCTARALAYPHPRPTASSQRDANTRATLMYLLEHRTDPHPESLERDAIRFRDVEVLSLIQRTRGLRYQHNIDLDAQAGEGNLPFLRFLVEHASVSCTTKAMDSAAAQGHIDVVRYLHETRTEGCTTGAMDSAAIAKHWEVVAYLDEHRSEGCTYVVLQTAVRLGRLDLVQRYYRHFPPQALSTACLVAGGYGFADIQAFLRNLVAPVATPL